MNLSILRLWKTLYTNLYFFASISWSRNTCQKIIYIIIYGYVNPVRDREGSQRPSISNGIKKTMKNANYSKKILKILGQKSAVSLPEIRDKVMSQKDCENPKYAITRSLKGLKEAGLIEQVSSPQNDYARLTKEGKKKAHSLELDNDTTLVNTSWDGLWRIILLDLPEDRKSERESLRYLLKKAGFVCLKNSAWISPFPFEHLVNNIKKDLELTTEMMIIVTDNIDEKSKKVLFETFGK